MTVKFKLDDSNTALQNKDEYQDQSFEASEGIDPTWDAGVVLKPEPAPKTYAVGDYVWVDADKNGLQDDTEVLKDVVVTLLDGEGKTVATTTTDENGRYIFDNLPAGDYQIKFELTDEQKEKYEFTVPNADENGQDKTDSDANPEDGLTVKFKLDDSNTALQNKDEYQDQSFEASEGIDPTWDAGVVLKPEPTTPTEPTEPTEPLVPIVPIEPPVPGKVAVGDKVWVDSNKDGKQDKGEPGIPNVVLDLYGPDGKKIGSTTTDKNGNYIFKDLPILKDGESYTVKINKKKSKEALAPYIPTIETDNDRENDSSTWESSSWGLTKDGEADLTLDFGFVLQPETVEPPVVDPSEPPVVEPGDGDNNGGNGDGNGAEEPAKKPENNLVATGFTALAALVGGLVLLLGGLVLVRRRTKNNEG